MAITPRAPGHWFRWPRSASPSLRPAPPPRRRPTRKHAGAGDLRLANTARRGMLAGAAANPFIFLHAGLVDVDRYRLAAPRRTTLPRPSRTAARALPQGGRG